MNVPANVKYESALRSLIAKRHFSFLAKSGALALAIHTVIYAAYFTAVSIDFYSLGYGDFNLGVGALFLLLFLIIVSGALLLGRKIPSLNHWSRWVTSCLIVIYAATVLISLGRLEGQYWQEAYGHDEFSIQIPDNDQQITWTASPKLEIVDQSTIILHADGYYASGDPVILRWELWSEVQEGAYVAGCQIEEENHRVLLCSASGLQSYVEVELDEYPTGAAEVAKSLTLESNRTEGWIDLASRNTTIQVYFQTLDLRHSESQYRLVDTVGDEGSRTSTGVRFDVADTGWVGGIKTQFLPGVGLVSGVKQLCLIILGGAVTLSILPGRNVRPPAAEEAGQRSDRLQGQRHAVTGFSVMPVKSYILIPKVKVLRRKRLKWRLQVYFEMKTDQNDI